MKDQKIIVETAIIGGGFSGLFLADSFIKSGYDSFVLLERHKNALGGYAVRGGIKIGLLPAGEITKKILNIKSYELYENQFVKAYDKYLIKPKTMALGISLERTPLINKYYYSYILQKVNAKNLIKNLYSRIGRKVLLSSVRYIVKNTGNSYDIHLENKITITCKNIIVATGRNYQAMMMLKEIGQIFIDKHDLLIGCRITFDSKSAEYLYRYQPDFKIKNKKLCQTYCFNYRGSINSYFYNNHKIYAGSFNEESKTGNCFIGCRKTTTAESVLKQIEQPFKISYNHLITEKWPKQLKNECSKITDFIEYFKVTFNLKIKNLYFPALEQFWSKPKLRKRSLESASLPNVYFIGDASGVSFGFLQCYITANLLAEHIR